MLKSRNLDDQSFDDIVAFARQRLPWLCPSWTDYNAHDPGITIIELMAWYKEMQQFHLNSVPDSVLRKLLKLAGVAPAPPSPAVCFVELTAEGDDAVYPPYSRAVTGEGVCFELLDTARRGGVRLTSTVVAASGGYVDISGIMNEQGISCRPFSYGGEENTQLLLGFDSPPPDGGELRVWFGVDDKRQVARNPFGEDSPDPRGLEWRFEGAGAAEPLYDETHALSVPGFIGFAPPGEWTATDFGAGSAYWLRVRQTDPGCEERLRLESVCVGRCRAVQRDTWSRCLRFFSKECGGRIELTDAQAMDAVVLAFIREDSGWRQVTDYADSAVGAGRLIVLDTSTAVGDEEPDIMLALLSPLHIESLACDLKGLPNEELILNLGGRTALTDSMELICDTLCPDGQVRPMPWRCTDDLSSAGPRDRVFVFRGDGETICFGDGRRGARPAGGRNAAVIASLSLTDCQEGNIPAGDSLRLGDEGEILKNTAASGGAPGESVRQAAERLAARLSGPSKCVSAEDYEYFAKATPGLRVAAAKAIPGYDPSEPAGKSRLPAVTVVVVPGSAAERPLPDERFLKAVYRQLSRVRPICTVVRVAPPKYCEIGVSVQVRATGAMVEQQLRELIASFLAIGPARQIGDRIIKNDLIAELYKPDGVLRVARVELRAVSGECYQNAAGDIIMPKNAVPCARTVEIDILS